jgi:hypothetical protein
MKKLDLFGNIIGLRYKGDWRYKTKTGGILSLLTMFICLGTLGEFLYRYLSRSDSYILYDNLKFWNPPMLNITEYRFPFAVIKYKNKVIDSPDILNINVIHRTINYQNQTIQMKN